MSIEILSNTAKIMNLVSELKGDLCIITNALEKIKKDDKKIDEEDEDTDVQDYLLKEIANISRRNSDTQIGCKKINGDNKENEENDQFLDPNRVTSNQNINKNDSSNESRSKNNDEN